MFITKLLDLFKPKAVPTPPPAAYPDTEFMEAVAKGWRERYASGPATGAKASTPPAGHDQAA
jgi:hypothetical protein